MKYFLYCESTEGGMNVREFSLDEAEEALSRLYGWMSSGRTLDEDKALLGALQTLPLGGVVDHRLGLCIRIRPECSERGGHR